MPVGALRFAKHDLIQCLGDNEHAQGVVADGGLLTNSTSSAVGLPSAKRRTTSASAFLGLDEPLHLSAVCARMTLKRAPRWSSFIQLESSDFSPGSALPNAAYSDCLMEGEGQPPEFFAIDLPPKVKYLHLTAEDVDAPRATGTPPALIWAKMNISPTASLGLTSTIKARTIVNYTPPDIKDENIHRIVFRIKATKNSITCSPEDCQEKLSVGEGPPRFEGRGEDFHEYMALAVAKQKLKNPPPDCGQPHQPMEDEGTPSFFQNEETDDERREDDDDSRKQLYRQHVKEAYAKGAAESAEVNRRGMGGQFQKPAGKRPQGDTSSRRVTPVMN